LSTNLASERLQTDTDLLLVITSTADELSGDTNVDDLERRWNRKFRIFSDFFRDFRLRSTLNSELSPKLLEIDQDNLRMKLHRCCRAFYEH